MCVSQLCDCSPGVGHPPSEHALILQQAVREVKLFVPKALVPLHLLTSTSLRTTTICITFNIEHTLQQ